MSCFSRKGFSLVELFVVIAIIMLILAMIIPAIQRARDAADSLKSMNHVRNINVAVQHFHSEHSRLPRFPVFASVLTFLEQGSIERRIFVSPSDPTMVEWKDGFCSYAANAQAFAAYRKLPSGVSDGSSHTIAFAEHYAYDIGNTSFRWDTNQPSVSGFGNRIMPAAFALNGPEVQPYIHNSHLFQDVYPIRNPSTGLTVASIPGMTFQTGPKPLDADPRIPQTPHITMIVAMLDGSIHRVTRSVSETVFWSAVTPNGGEIFGIDWE